MRQFTWRASVPLRSQPAPSQAHASAPGAPSVTDVSELTSAKKIVGRASLATRFLGIIISFFPLFFFVSLTNNWLAGLVPMGIVIWVCFTLASSISRGSLKAAQYASLAFIAYALQLVIFWDIFTHSFLLVSLASIAYFALGMYRLHRYARQKQSGRGDDGAVILQSLSKSHTVKKPAFLGKLEPRCYLYLIFSFLLFVASVISLMQPSSHQRQAYPAESGQDRARLIGTNIGSLLFKASLESRVGSDKSEAYILGADSGRVASFIFIGIVVPAMLYRQARKLAMARATGLQATPSSDTILYLRSFSDDNLKMRAHATNGRTFFENFVKIAFEEVVVDQLWRYGPVLAVGNQGRLGAPREQLPEDAWRPRVEQLMQQAAMIVLVVGRTESLAWELNRAAELGCLRRLVLLLPPARTDDLWERWAFLRERAAGWGERLLPPTIDLERARAIVFPGQGAAQLIVADERDAWSYETALDAAAALVLQPAGVRPALEAPAMLKSA